MQATTRSTPMPKPGVGTLPYLRRSRCTERRLAEFEVFDSLLEEVVAVDLLGAAYDFAVALGGEDVDRIGEAVAVTTSERWSPVQDANAAIAPLTALFKGVGFEK